MSRSPVQHGLGKPGIGGLGSKPRSERRVSVKAGPIDEAIARRNKTHMLHAEEHETEEMLSNRLIAGTLLEEREQETKFGVQDLHHMERGSASPTLTSPIRNTTELPTASAVEERQPQNPTAVQEVSFNLSDRSRILVEMHKARADEAFEFLREALRMDDNKLLDENMKQAIDDVQSIDLDKYLANARKRRFTVKPYFASNISKYDRIELFNHEVDELSYEDLLTPETDIEAMVKDLGRELGVIKPDGEWATRCGCEVKLEEIKRAVKVDERRISRARYMTAFVRQMDSMIDFIDNFVQKCEEAEDVRSKEVTEIREKHYKVLAKNEQQRQMIDRMRRRMKDAGISLGGEDQNAAAMEASTLHVDMEGDAYKEYLSKEKLRKKAADVPKVRVLAQRERLLGVSARHEKAQLAALDRDAWVNPQLKMFEERRQQWGGAQTTSVGSQTMNEDDLMFEHGIGLGKPKGPAKNNVADLKKLVETVAVTALPRQTTAKLSSIAPPPPRPKGGELPTEDELEDHDRAVKGVDLGNKIEASIHTIAQRATDAVSAVETMRTRIMEVVSSATQSGDIEELRQECEELFPYANGAVRAAVDPLSTDLLSHGKGIMASVRELVGAHIEAVDDISDLREDNAVLEEENEEIRQRLQKAEAGELSSPQSLATTPRAGEAKRRVSFMDSLSEVPLQGATPKAAKLKGGGKARKKSLASPGLLSASTTTPKAKREKRQGGGKSLAHAVERSEYLAECLGSVKAALIEGTRRLMEADRLDARLVPKGIDIDDDDDDYARKAVQASQADFGSSSVLNSSRSMLGSTLGASAFADSEFGGSSSRRLSSVPFGSASTPESGAMIIAGVAMIEDLEKAITPEAILEKATEWSTTFMDIAASKSDPAAPMDIIRATRSVQRAAADIIERCNDAGIVFPAAVIASASEVADIPDDALASTVATFLGTAHAQVNAAQQSIKSQLGIMIANLQRPLSEACADSARAIGSLIRCMREMFPDYEITDDTLIFANAMKELARKQKAVADGSRRKSLSEREGIIDVEATVFRIGQSLRAASDVNTTFRKYIALYRHQQQLDIESRAHRLARQIASGDNLAGSRDYEKVKEEQRTAKIRQEVEDKIRIEREKMHKLMKDEQKRIEEIELKNQERLALSEENTKKAMMLREELRELEEKQITLNASQALNEEISKISQTHDSLVADALARMEESEKESRDGIAAMEAIKLASLVELESAVREAVIERVSISSPSSQSLALGRTPLLGNSLEPFSSPPAADDFEVEDSEPEDADNSLEELPHGDPARPGDNNVTPLAKKHAAPMADDPRRTSSIFIGSMGESDDGRSPPKAQNTNAPTAEKSAAKKTRTVGFTVDTILRPAVASFSSAMIPNGSISNSSGSPSLVVPPAAFGGTPQQGIPWIPGHGAQGLSPKAAGLPPGEDSYHSTHLMAGNVTAQPSPVGSSNQLKGGPSESSKQRPARARGNSTHLAVASAASALPSASNPGSPEQSSLTATKGEYVYHTPRSEPSSARTTASDLVFEGPSDLHVKSADVKQHKRRMDASLSEPSWDTGRYSPFSSSHGTSPAHSRRSSFVMDAPAGPPIRRTTLVPVGSSPNGSGTAVPGVAGWQAVEVDFVERGTQTERPSFGKIDGSSSFSHRIGRQRKGEANSVESSRTSGGKSPDPEAEEIREMLEMELEQARGDLSAMQSQKVRQKQEVDAMYASAVRVAAILGGHPIVHAIGEEAGGLPVNKKLVIDPKPASLLGAVRSVDGLLSGIAQVFSSGASTSITPAARTPASSVAATPQEGHQSLLMAELTKMEVDRLESLMSSTHSVNKVGGGTGPSEQRTSGTLHQLALASAVPGSPSVPPSSVPTNIASPASEGLGSPPNDRPGLGGRVTTSFINDTASVMSVMSDNSTKRSSQRGSVHVAPEEIWEQKCKRVIADLATERARTRLFNTTALESALTVHNLLMGGFVDLLRRIVQELGGGGNDSIAAKVLGVMQRAGDPFAKIATERLGERTGVTLQQVLRHDASLLGGLDTFLRQDASLSRRRISVNLEQAAVRLKLNRMREKRKAGQINTDGVVDAPALAAFLDRQEAKMKKAIKQYQNIKDGIAEEKGRQFYLPQSDVVEAAQLPGLPEKRRLTALLRSQLRTPIETLNSERIAIDGITETKIAEAPPLPIPAWNVASKEEEAILTTKKAQLQFRSPADAIKREHAASAQAYASPPLPANSWTQDVSPTPLPANGLSDEDGDRIAKLLTSPDTQRARSLPALQDSRAPAAKHVVLPARSTQQQPDRRLLASYLHGRAAPMSVKKSAPPMTGKRAASVDPK